MSKLAHSNDETMAEIERTDDLLEPGWDCFNCGDRRFVLKRPAEPVTLETIFSGHIDTVPCPDCNADERYPVKVPIITISNPTVK